MMNGRGDATADTLPSLGDCLSEDEVLAFAQGSDAPSSVRARIDEHLDACPVCLELVSHVARDSQDSRDQNLGRRSRPCSPGIATTFAPGALVGGRYRIERFVARGGMGEVYEARDHKLNERVALKAVVCTAEDSPRAARKLCDEVQLARRIQHHNVCRIHELHEHVARGSDHPVQFLSMEFIDGVRLGDYIRHGGRLSLDDAVSVARQLLAGLRAAHAAHVLHLDFKTDNVMLRNGQGVAGVVIMDFGLSRAFESEARLRTSEHRELAGSLAYMSPEQVECRERLGPEADIYAFGIVLFEMLTGRLPFEGDSPVAMMMKRLKERPPPPSRVVPGLSSCLDSFVLKCLSRDARSRYHDIASAVAALESAVSRPTPAGRWRPGIRAALALATLLGGATWYLRVGLPERTSASDDQTELALERLEPARVAPPVAAQDSTPLPKEPPPPARPLVPAERVEPRAKRPASDAPARRKPAPASGAKPPRPSPLPGAPSRLSW